MGIFLLLMLLFPGVCGLSSSVSRHFHLVKEYKSWPEAQQHCREEFTDLATIDNMADIEEIKKVIQDAGVGAGWGVWIGLKNGSSPKWQWSLADKGFYGENEAEFRNWGKGQPDSNAAEGCVWIHENGKWYDYPCYLSRPFICYNGPNSPQPYVLVEDPKTWTDAQRYCREHYTDLASVRNQTENDKITDLLTGAEGYAWIGLFRDAWEWSDGSSSSFRHWDSWEPNNDISRSGLCVYMKSSGWNDEPCNLLIYFVCYEDLLPTASVKVVSPPLPFYSGDDVTLSCDIPEYTDWFRYVWLKDSTTLPGKTNKSITITLPLEAGQYSCSGERGDRPKTSSMSLPTVIAHHDLPMATVEVVSPQSPFYSGDNVTLKCNIMTYTDWQQYVWVNNGSKVMGKTNQTITITLPLEAGQYQCSGERGGRPETSSMSLPTAIAYHDLPLATVEVVSPQSLFYSGDNVTLKCNVMTYTDWQQYVWFNNGSKVMGKTNQTITITLPLEAGQYQCSGERQDRPMTSSVSKSVNIISNTLVKRTQMVRVEMEASDDVDMEDPDVQKAFLQQIEDRLKAKGFRGDVKLSWMKQPDGKVFHKKNDKKKEKRDEL